MSDSQDIFFVGYLRTPQRLGRFLKVAAIGCIAVSVGLSALLAGAQRDPGAGTWAADQIVGIEGVLWEKPYPLLRTEAAGFLLVDQGKRGVTTRVRGLDGHRVRVRGYRLIRGELQLLELADEPHPVEPLGTIVAPPPASNHEERPRVVMRGEIVDPKCFSGAMKPGDGKTHKACAALCLRGGIPPVLVAAASDGSSEYYVLTNRSGDPLDGVELAKVIAVVGEPVEVEGAIETSHDFRVLNADIDTLRRR
jgi:hypothetical protein